MPASARRCSSSSKAGSLNCGGRRQVAALDGLPRPTLVTCRVGPRSSALVYSYAGLRAGASAAEVLERAETEDAPLVKPEELRAWVAQGLEELS